MKKLLVLLMTVACALCLAFAVGGCTDENGESLWGGTNTQQGDTGGGGNDDALEGYIYKCSQTEHWQVNSDGEETAHSPHTVTDGVCPTCGYVEKYTEGLKFTEIKEDEETVGYEVSRGTATDSDIYIPSFYNDLPVIAIEDVYHEDVYHDVYDVYQAFAAGYIGREVFSNIKNLISVTIGNNVTYIGREAFAGCTNLTDITIPDRVTSIGREAFYNCTSLESITVSDRNTAYASQDGILYNKDKTKFIHIPQAIKGSITIPNGVTSIGKDAFSGCTGLTSITIPDSVTSIGNSALFGCKRLKSVIIGNGVTSIGYEAFYGCTKLESVTFKNSNGWYRTSSSSATGGTDIPSEDLKNPQTAATYLKSTYKNYWKRKTA